VDGIVALRAAKEKLEFAQGASASA